MDEGAWQATVHMVAESDMTEQLTQDTTGVCVSSQQIIKFHMIHQILYSFYKQSWTQVRFLF